MNKTCNKKIICYFLNNFFFSYIFKKSNNRCRQIIYVLITFIHISTHLPSKKTPSIYVYYIYGLIQQNLNYIKHTCIF